MSKKSVKEALKRSTEAWEKAAKKEEFMKKAKEDHDRAVIEAHWVYDLYLREKMLNE